MLEALFGKAVSQVLQGIPASQDPLWRELHAWTAKLAERAPGRWRAVIMSGIACGTHACQHPPVGACVVCRTPTCLAHALVSGGADVVCFTCVQAAAVAGNGPKVQPVHDEETKRKQFLKTLGLKPDASFEQVQAAFKKVAVKNHPDKTSKLTPDKRAEAELKFKKASEAYHWLLDHMSKKAA